MPMKRACVIGAGFGGLALAIRLQSAGVDTVLVEARDKVGGRAGWFEREGFTFDAGPTAITDPGAFRDLWQLSGRDFAGDVTLLPVAPHYRLNWTDGTSLDIGGDDPALRREIARIAPEDAGGYEEFLRYAASVTRHGRTAFGEASMREAGAMARLVPGLLRLQAWRSAHSIVSSFVKNEKLRQALSFQVLFAGGNPVQASALYAAIYKLERDNGVWWVEGGTGRLVAAMAAHFQRLGGTLRLHDPVLHIHALGDKVSEVESVSGWRERFDAVASNADVMHSYRDLLADSARGPDMARSLAKKRYSHSVFMVHFGLEGTWPGIPHHMMLFGPRYKALLADIFDHGVLPQDMMIHLHHPTVTDPSMAPPGKSAFTATIPVANLGRLPIDWEQVGPVIEKRILDEVSRRLIPDIHDRLVTRFHYSPRDFVLDLNSFQGSAYGLEPLLTQSGWLRPGNRDARLRNFYLVGAATHPGAGIPAVLASAQNTAGLMLEGLAI